MLLQNSFPRILAHPRQAIGSLTGFVLSPDEQRETARLVLL